MTGELATLLASPVPARTSLGHAAGFAKTEARLEALLPQVPITRVYDATALDRLDLPVWAAVTPLSADLTVHAGKGTTSQAARISAVMEAIERVCAETTPGETQHGTLEELRACGLPALDPLLFDPPFGFASTAWVAGYDVLADRPCLVPRDLVISPGPFGPETNGLAAGNVYVEAVLHALLEVIERDAAAVRYVTRWYAEQDAAVALRLVDPGSLPPQAEGWIARLGGVGVRTTIEELTCDTGVPVFRAVLLDTAFPGHEGKSSLFAGLGADLDPAVAVMRALSEAVQAHTAEFVGARDTYEGDADRAPSRERALRWLSTRSVLAPFPTAVAAPLDLGERLALVLERLRAVGFEHCAVVDLTREDLGIPVVRVLLAGAAGPYPETARRPATRLLQALV